MVRKVAIPVGFQASQPSSGLTAQKARNLAVLSPCSSMAGKTGCVSRIVDDLVHQVLIESDIPLD